LSRSEAVVEAGGVGLGASVTAAISTLSEKAAGTLGLSFAASLLHAIVVGLYAVVFAGLTYLILKDRLRPRSPILRLWLNTFAFCVALILLDSQMRWLSSQMTRALQSWPVTMQAYAFLQTSVGAELYFLTPIAGAGLVSVLIFLSEDGDGRYPALRKVARIFS